MSRQAQGAILLTLGATLLSISAFSTTYVNYVKPGFRPLLMGAGAVLTVLGLLSVVADLLNRPSTHDHGPRVAWLLTAPVFALVLIAPPALGAFAARRTDGPPAPSRTATYSALAQSEVTELTLGEFIGRAYAPSDPSLAGRKVRLIGFAVPGEGGRGWYLTRMHIRCCAADAFALEVAVHGAPAPAEDSWVAVTGTWMPWRDGVPDGYGAPDFTATDVTGIEQPAEPYE
ncbi:TIGR03943 family protein [Nonomuraea solani]|uniref:TIGR03943 family protein n=1 Tax=Nonomuraea solani TaxID=1144553 RepID=A0A1H6DA14_9ACTN|nr:TIGR03943 family protein [Nonomuraea solani]SEG82231.1 TIGR03943 family protein [Nonomuraea solani]